MIYIGVDPGKTGAVAVISNRLTDVRDFEDMSALGLLIEIQKIGFQYMACVEAVHSMPGQGVSTTFKFGKSTGRVIGWLEALYFPYQEVTPTKWQKVIYDSGEKVKDKKTRSLEMARKMFPTLHDKLKRKKDHNRAEALLIAEYCRRTTV